MNSMSKYSFGDCYVPTQNKMGYALRNLDPITAQFIDFCKLVKLPVLEIGAGYGFTTVEALKQGATVVCNDLEKAHLDFLIANTPKELRKKLILKPGDFPEQVDITNFVFDGILISRVLHVLDGNHIKRLLKKCYNHLSKSGKLFIIVDTPYLRNCMEFIPFFEQRMRDGVPWPGIITDVPKYVTGDISHFPPMINLQDKGILEPVLERLGFIIEKCDYIERPDYPEDRQWDARESLGIICVKP